jgi:hypothetical protein
MNQYKIDLLNTVDENIKAILKEDPVIYKFDVIPLDYHVNTLSSPQVYLSLNKFIFVYDEIIEIHDLFSVEFDILGDEPHFKLYEQLTESGYVYSESDPASYKKLKDDDSFVRLNYFEQGQIPKSLVLRNQKVTAKPFQTWAMAQIILNINNRIPKDIVLEEMLTGNFYKFNTSTIVIFMIIVVVYFTLHFIINATIKGIAGNILDLLFTGALVAMGVWTYLSIEKNNQKFYTTYLRYKPGDKISNF